MGTAVREREVEPPCSVQERRGQAHPSRVRFPTASPFHAELRRAVDAHLAATAGSSRGDWRMAVKVVTTIAWAVLSYLALVFADVALWARLLLAISLGAAMAGIGFGVMHDGNHGSVSHRRWVSRALGFTVDLLGGSSYFWKQRHNVLHHTYTNVSGLDGDLDAHPLLRFTPDQPLRPIHRYQHVYVWLLYAVYPLGWWFLDDFQRLITGRVGAMQMPRPRRGQIVAFWLGKAAFVSWAFVLPALVYRSWVVVPFTLVAVAVLGITLATVFQLAHCVAEADFHEGRPGEMGTDWATHQVTTTVDFARDSRILSWYLGGLNFQIEHHLFPKVCHVHYRALSPVVEEVCRRHGVRYRSQASLGAAIAANVRWLRLLGSQRSPQPAA